MRALFTIKFSKERNKEYPTDEEISEKVFSDAGWADNKISKLPDWESKLKEYLSLSAPLFQNSVLPEAASVEDKDKVIFYGTMNKEVKIIVTRTNDSEINVRLIEPELLRLQETTESIIKTLKERYKTLNDSKIVIEKDRVIIYEKGHDHKIIKGDIVLNKISLNTVKKENKGNYILFLVSFVASASFLVLYYYYQNQYTDKLSLTFLTIFATSFTKLIQTYLELKKYKIIKWMPISNEL
jgi:dihydroneopterin aldolase